MPGSNPITPPPTLPNPPPNPTTILSLPPELHLLITTHLPPFPDLQSLKLTCTYFHALIPPLTHPQLLSAELTDLATGKSLYACRYCLRLRPAERFADRMLKRRRGKRGKHAARRFCVECGLMPRGAAGDRDERGATGVDGRSGGDVKGEARYGAGARIVVGGVGYVVCMECGRFGVCSGLSLKGRAGGGGVCEGCMERVMVGEG
ncbi:hypothetical protein BJX61DRAFT_540514 [Aspergillus egyptiacus]|nr:hypothetical protein BJX61DRAFT_540514 [Aspergillus egyptiacus]